MLEVSNLAATADGLNGLPRARSSLLPALFAQQRAEGFISDQALQAIALHVRATPNEVEGVVSGYPEFRRMPPAEHTIRVCTGTSCMCGGGSSLLKELLKAKEDGDSALTGIEIEPVPCLFACAVGPVVELDGVCHGRAARETALRELAVKKSGGGE